MDEKIRPVAPLVLNPRVREMFEAAVKAAREFWIGVMMGDAEPWPRQSTYMEPSGDGTCHFNTRQLLWRAQSPIVINGVCVALTPGGAYFVSGPTDYVLQMHAGDSLFIVAGGVCVYGSLPSG